MNTNLTNDEFYVKHPTEGRFFSIAGIQFMTELLAQAVQTVGWDPTKVSIGTKNDFHVWIGYPSASTKIVTHIRVEDGKLIYQERNAGWRAKDNELSLAHPDLVKAFGEILVKNIPKNSKFYA